MKIRHLLLFLFFGFRLFAQGEQWGLVSSVHSINNTNGSFHFDSSFSIGTPAISPPFTYTTSIIDNTLFVKGYYNVCGIWPALGSSSNDSVVYTDPLPSNITTITMSTNLITYCETGTPIIRENLMVTNFPVTLNVATLSQVISKWFPNPVKDELHLNTSAEPATAYELYTVQGQLVQSATGTTSTIECSVLPKGIYLLRFEQNGVWNMEKICKE
ncbi:T9SS type A sorting domain-containing protein [Flavobacterium sp.]|uniref:T9SS type A sorting domain-containing protein n=1 Tax=Flavobacterium sp. TaxID=239 RepID=UPI00334096B3